LNYNTWAEETHPDWRMQITKDGLSLHQREDYRYGLCCPNNPDYRAFTVAQVTELLNYVPLEGIFFDMTFWPYLCQCPHCLTRWKEESGMDETPACDWHDPMWRRYVTAREKWMGEFARFVSDAAKRVVPGITTEHNYASGASGDWKHCVTEEVNEACDYCGGDLYGDLYSHSFAAKYYKSVSKHQPFEYMTSRSDADLYQHTVTKSENRLTAEVLLTAAHHGASLLIDAIEPDGTQDERIYERIGRVFGKQIPYEPYFCGESVEDVAVYYSASGRFDPDHLGLNHHDVAVKAVKRMIEQHISCGVIANDHLERLPQYPCVVAPQISGITEQAVDALVNYVREGGHLYLSGACEPKLLQALLGGEFSGFTESSRTFVSPTAGSEDLFGDFTPKYPIQINHRMPLLAGCGDEGVLAKINLPLTLPDKTPFVSIHSSPPATLTDFPAVICRAFGKGRVLWAASPLENDDRPSVRSVFASLIALLLPEEDRTVKATLPKTVETVAFRDETRYLVSLIDYLSVDDERIVPPCKIMLKASVAPRSVKLLPDGEPIPFVYDAEAGAVVFETQSLSTFAMYEIAFENNCF